MNFQLSVHGIGGISRCEEDEFEKEMQRFE
jgi:hypothetical protein